MKPMIIASIYAPSELNAQWYKLQKRFIEKTTKIEYDYKIILNGANSGDFSANDILLDNRENKGHSYALSQLLNYFRSHPYGCYLILDSDCFPVWNGWHDVLIEQMEKFNKIIAAPVRTENLDVFPHPSAFFILGKGIDHPKLNFDPNETINLLGDKVVEVAGAMQSMTAQLLPMVRSNVRNLHPVAAAVYHHLFYHHGAGSRDFNFRILKRYDYYWHWMGENEPDKQCNQLLDALMSNPDKFIHSLMYGNSHKILRKWLSLSRWR